MEDCEKNILRELTNEEYNCIYTEIVTMIILCGMAHTGEIVSKVPRYSSADHNSCFKIVIEMIREYIDDSGENREVFEPNTMYLPKVNELLSCEIYKKLEIDFRRRYVELYDWNCVKSIEEGLWIPSLEEEAVRLRLHKSIRRAAIHLVSIKAEYLASTEGIKKLLSDENNMDFVKLALEGGLNELGLITKGMKEDWKLFIEKFSYNEDNIISFLGYIAYLMKIGLMWFDEELLFAIWMDYIKEYAQKTVTKETFRELIELFAITIEEAYSWSVQSPFIKIGQSYAFWPHYFRSMHPNLLLIVMWSKKYSDLWNNTLGGQFAKVASYIRGELNNYEGKFIVTEKIRKGIGDIDLAIYDSAHNYLVICEIKSVFDKFRTNYQLHNYVNQRVNFDKANKQLKKNYDAIESGIWSMKEIFGQGFNKPCTITKMIITWWDIINPNIGTQYEENLVCNIAVFKYLYNQCEGNIPEFIEIIKELSMIYCPAKLMIDSAYNDGEEIEYIREVQTDVLPSQEKMNAMNLSIGTKRVIKDIAKIPDDWNEQIRKNGDDPDSWYFYDD